MEIDISIVAAYLFVTDITGIGGNLALKQLFLWSAILFSCILYCRQVKASLASLCMGY